MSCFIVYVDFRKAIVKSFNVLTKVTAVSEKRLTKQTIKIFVQHNLITVNRPWNDVICSAGSPFADRHA
jgi:hypothetical protein